MSAAQTKSFVQTQKVLGARVLPTPLGPMLARASETGLVELEFDRSPVSGELDADIGAAHLDSIAHEIDAYFAGSLQAFRTSLDLRGTPFQVRVWRALLDIPFGQTRSYSQLARALGSPDAVRAVAAANGANRIAIVVPCHRVVGSDGSLTGYASGLHRKEWLLRHEGSRLV